VTDFQSFDLNRQIAVMRGVAEAALLNWSGSFRDIELIKYRENAVFSVRNDTGERFALRVHRAGYHSDAELRSELQWMSALAEAGIRVPFIVPARSGAIFVKVALSTMPVFQVDMLGWLNGEPVGSVEGMSTLCIEELCALYDQAGQLAAHLHDHGNGWQPPADFTRHAWDTNGLIGPHPFWGAFRELPALAEHLELIEAVCRKAETQLETIGRSAQVYGMIHADFVPENLLLAESSLMLIDFDDAGFGWHMFELATALYFHLDTPHFEAIRAALLAGYQSVRPLSDAYVQQLPLFLLLRSITYLSWVHTRRETETARELMPMFVERTVELARQYLA
jgi:Ser/Thr protein kinase RdoA (MazF antagonist)